MIKKILKWLGRTLLIALVGVFAIALGAYLYFDKEDLKQQAIAWVYETTGHKITAGDIYLEFSLIPTFGADNIAISEAYGDQDFIKAGSVSIGLDIIDFIINDNVKITQAKLIKPEIWPHNMGVVEKKTTKTDNDQASNDNDKATDKQNENKNVKLSISSFIVEDGRLYSDKSITPVLVIDNAKIVGDDISGNVTYKNLPVSFDVAFSDLNSLLLDQKAEIKATITSADIADLDIDAKFNLANSSDIKIKSDIINVEAITSKLADKPTDKNVASKNNTKSGVSNKNTVDFSWLSSLPNVKAEILLDKLIINETLPTYTNNSINVDTQPNLVKVTAKLQHKKNVNTANLNVTNKQISLDASIDNFNLSEHVDAITSSDPSNVKLNLYATPNNQVDKILSSMVGKIIINSSNIVTKLDIPDLANTAIGIKDPLAKLDKLVLAYQVKSGVARATNASVIKNNTVCLVPSGDVLFTQDKLNKKAKLYRQDSKDQWKYVTSASITGDINDPNVKVDAVNTVINNSKGLFGGKLGGIVDDIADVFSSEKAPSICSQN
jgi:hypothetical protein